jgi:hypothetical protein
LSDEARTAGGFGEELKKLEEVKRDWRFEKKLDYAERLIPASLKPSGRSPFEPLHDLTSEGLHHRSDEECLEQFDACRAAFGFF